MLSRIPLFVLLLLSGSVSLFFVLQTSSASGRRSANAELAASVEHANSTSSFKSLNNSAARLNRGGSDDATNGRCEPCDCHKVFRPCKHKLPPTEPVIDTKPPKVLHGAKPAPNPLKGVEAAVVTLTMQDAVVDRFFPAAVTIDMYYSLKAASLEFRDAASISYAWMMHSLHGRNVWEDAPEVVTFLERTKSRHNPGGGSPILDWESAAEWLLENTPRVIVEVGVFRGTSTIGIATWLTEHGTAALQDTFVISVDTFQVDLEFIWRASDQYNDSAVKAYFDSPRLGGYNLLYFNFMANVLSAQVEHRVVPLIATSTVGALSLLAWRVPVGFIYLDASHSNPDVLIDLVTWWQLLDSKRGGLMICDDYMNYPSVTAAVSAAVANADKLLPQLGSHGVIGLQYWLHKKGQMTE